MFKFISVVFSFIAVSVAAQSHVAHEVVSPDGSHKVQIRCIKNNEGDTRIQYSVSYYNRPVVLPSSMELELDNRTWEQAMAKNLIQNTNWFASFELDSLSRSSQHLSWQNAYGERSLVRDNYKGITLHFSRNDASKYRVNIEIRAYNQGIAFRYVFPMHPDGLYHRLKSDKTEFKMPDGASVWATPWAQGPYEKIKLSELNVPVERPLCVELDDSLYVCLTEAAQIHFPRSKFELLRALDHTLGLKLDGNADLVTPFHTPWRVVIASNRLGGLLEQNDILLNLNQSSRISDESWIKPGKILRETTLTTQNALKCIDFCEAHSMQYILFDWQWYGPAFDYASDATQVVAPNLDLQKVIAYGKEKGIGVWVYVNQHALEKQADVLFPLFEAWGLVGVKFGFVQFATHRWSVWLDELIEKAAKHKLMVNIHDEYRVSGNQRSFPNIMTVEGIRGNEEFPTAGHNTITALTRAIAGMSDYTVCYFDPRLKHTTHAHQLALPVIFFSPLQTLYWYDTPDRIEPVPELEFFDNVPVVWDETKVIHDDIERLVTLARRSSSDWYIGSIAGDQSINTILPLDFLREGKTYMAHIYTDDETVQTKTKVRVSRFLVQSEQQLRFRLKNGGGVAIHFEMLKEKPSRATPRYRGQML